MTDGDVEDGAGEVVFGEEEVGATANDHEGLGEGVPVKFLQIFFLSDLYKKRTGHLHAEGVPCT